MDVRPEWILPEGPAAGSLRDRVLARRGLTGERDRQLFAGPTPPLSLLREPASLPGADAVAAALDAWLKEGLSIAVYGDYDADGICAAAIVARLLRLFGGNPRTLAQAKALEKYLDVLLVLHLICPDEDEMVRRMRRRALKENRLDDADEKVIRRRFEVYRRETAPILSHYPASTIKEVPATGSPAMVLMKVLDIVAPLQDHHFRNPLNA